MQDKEREKDKFVTMKELGQLLGLTNHQVGKMLKEMGYRTHDGKPSLVAFSLDMVQQRFKPGSWERYCWAWSYNRTLPLLRDALEAQAQGKEPTP